MGLAPYGEPKYTDKIIGELIHLKDDGSFRLNMKYFNFATGLTMTNEKFSNYLGISKRSKNELLTKFHMDIAASIQEAIEIIVLKLVRNIQKETKIKNLCLAGGVALNCVANGKIVKNKIFDNVWIQPASGDAGGSLGVALAFWHQELSKPRYVNKLKDNMSGSYLGPKYEENFENDLKELGANYIKCQREEILKKLPKNLT